MKHDFIAEQDKLADVRPASFLSNDSSHRGRKLPCLLPTASRERSTSKLNVLVLGRFAPVSGR